MMQGQMREGMVIFKSGLTDDAVNVQKHILVLNRDPTTYAKKM
jgi:hypothetical protein